MNTPRHSRERLDQKATVPAMKLDEVLREGNPVTDNLDLWTSALLNKSTAGRGSNGKQEAYGIKKLRELIMELAVMGKLVPQDPGDESVSILVEKISEERESLIRDGVIRKYVPQPEIIENEKPFAIPPSWKYVRFGDITFNRDAERIPLSVDERRGRQGEYDYYGASGIIDFIDDYLFDKPLLLIGEDGANLINRSTPIAFIARGKYWVNNHAHVLDGLTEGLLHYIGLHINAISLEQYVTGTAQPKMNQAKMNAIVLALPPLAEQHRIVAKVDELMALCDQLEQQQTDSLKAHQTLVKTLFGTLINVTDQKEFAEAWQRIANHFDTLFTTEHSIDQLKQTILQLAVMGKLVPQDPKDEPANVLLQNIIENKGILIREGIIKSQKKLHDINEKEKAFKLPVGWEWVKFGLISEFINGDRSKNYPNRNEYVEEGVPWINTGHIEPNGTLTKRDMNFITRKKFDSLRSGKIQTGDLVYCLRGATFGKTAFVDPYKEGAIASSLMIIRPYITELNSYIYRYLISPLGRSQIFRFDNGSAQPNLSANSVMLYAFPLPPLKEQHRIVAKVDELMTLCDTLKARLNDAQTTQIHLADVIVEQAVA